MRLDVYVKDSKRVFDNEIQTTNNGNLLQRARYYQAMIDIDELKKGEDYLLLKESYILFICTFDPFNKGLYKYSFSLHCEEVNDVNNPNDSKLNDKTYKIFYNIKEFEQSKDKDVQAFLRYLATKEATSDFTKSLENAVFDAKGHDKWRAGYMTLGMKFDEYRMEGRREGRKEGLEEGRKKGLSQGLSQGAQQKAFELARNFIKMNFPLEQIALGTGLTLDEIKKLQIELKNVSV